MPITKEILRKYLTNCFIETGTFQGQGVEEALAAGFPFVRSVELSSSLYTKNLAKFHNNPSVKLYLGASEKLLGLMIEDLTKPATFWLDAHYSGGITEMSDQVCPLIEELEIIARHPVKDHVLLIDDVRLFGNYLPGITVEIVKNAVRKINPAYQFSFEDGEVPDDILVCRIPEKQAEPKSGSTVTAHKPLISVIGAVYNGEKYLEDALQSIFAQTFYDFEYIMVNDASTDGSAECLSRINDPRLRIITNNEQLGLTKSLNIAASQARGEFLARMDADDISLPHRFQLQIDFLQSHPKIAMVGSSYYVINEEGAILMLLPVLTDPRQINEGLLKQNWFGHGSVIMRKSVFDELGGYNEQFIYAQDYDLWLRISERYSLANIEEPLYCWRKTSVCISQVKGAQQMDYARRALSEARKRRGLGDDPLNSSVIAHHYPLVSVIVPTYNRPQMLADALKSIANQTWDDFEVIIINDGGIDVTDVIKSSGIAEKINYISLGRNSERSYVRNAGLKLARGKYIAYLDDDDIYYPDHLQTLIDTLKQSGNRAAYSDAYRAVQVLADGKFKTIRRELIFYEDFSINALLVHNQFPNLCVMHERSLINEIGYFDESLNTHEDWDYWIRIGLKCPFVHVKKITAEYTHRNDESNTTSYNFNDFNRTREIIYQRYSQYTKDNPQIKAMQQSVLDFMKLENPVDVKTFIEVLVKLSQGNKVTELVKYYDLNRNKFEDSEDLDKVDQMIEKLRVHLIAKNVIKQ